MPVEDFSERVGPREALCRSPSPVHKHRCQADNRLLRDPPVAASAAKPRRASSTRTVANPSAPSRNRCPGPSAPEVTHIGLSTVRARTPPDPPRWSPTRYCSATFARSRISSARSSRESGYSSPGPSMTAPSTAAIRRRSSPTHLCSRFSCRSNSWASLATGRFPLMDQVRGFNPVLRGKRTPTTRYTNILPGDRRPAIADVHYFWGTSNHGSLPPPIHDFATVIGMTRTARRRLGLTRPAAPHRHRPPPLPNPRPDPGPRPPHQSHQRRHRRSPPRLHPRPHQGLPTNRRPQRPQNEKVPDLK